MLRKTADMMICPKCLPKEKPLKLKVNEENNEDIISGKLNCPNCSTSYSINFGIAQVLPDPNIVTNSSQLKYEKNMVVSSYLWSHYADLINDPDAGNAYQKWSSHIPKKASTGLDIGCSVGRMAFEMSASCEYVIGVDLSMNFIKTARGLADKGFIDFELVMEGRITQTRTINLKKNYARKKVDFIVADALALPFPKETFPLVSSLNVLDKVPKPIKNLQEVGRVASKNNSRFIFSDPFSWSTESTKEEDWLGGKKNGDIPVWGKENVCSLLEGKDNILPLPWRIESTEKVDWRIRTHRNHFEFIKSQCIVADR